jgi:hypothetical protein
VWSGSVQNSYFNQTAVLLADGADQGEQVPCLPMGCDPFKLTVVDTDDLTLAADAPESTSTDGSVGSQVTLRIFRPDGSTELHSTGEAGATPEKPLVVKIKKAPQGPWRIEYFNYFQGRPIPYNASATLGSPAGPPAEGTTTTHGPDQPPPQQGLTVDVTASKISAAKANRAKKVAATLTVSRQVKRATATLKAGGKIVAKGAVGAFSGTTRVALKLSKKLKAGRYSLTVVADDGAGTIASNTGAIKVTK